MSREYWTTNTEQGSGAIWATHDPYSEPADIMANELRDEIDREILEAIRRRAAPEPVEMTSHPMSAMDLSQVHTPYIPLQRNPISEERFRQEYQNNFDDSNAFFNRAMIDDIRTQGRMRPNRDRPTLKDLFSIVDSGSIGYESVLKEFRNIRGTGADGNVTKKVLEMIKERMK